ncbi:MAG TPA: hypothetical protein VFZ52_25450, partial [Chryseolinea sp.]
WGKSIYRTITEKTEFYKTFVLNCKSNSSRKAYICLEMKFLKTILVFAMVFLVLVSSSSFMVGIHWCGGEIYSLALSEAEDCGMEKKVPPCHKHIVASCCDDDAILHEGDGFKASISDITLTVSPPLDLALADVILSEVVPSVAFLQPRYYNYDPPLRSHDLTVSHRVFLI